MSDYKDDDIQGELSVDVDTETGNIQVLLFHGRLSLHRREARKLIKFLEQAIVDSEKI